jgi:hypothetical protein
MAYIVCFFTGVTLGAIAGILAYRNNVAKAQSAETKAKTILNLLKGR